MQSFTVTLTFIKEQISDLLCRALQEAKYWCETYEEEVIEPTYWEFDSAPGYAHRLYDYPLNSGGALLIHDMEAENSENEVLRLDGTAIQRGLEALVAKYPYHVANILNKESDPISDDNTGDAFLQCCLFGEIIYS